MDSGTVLDLEETQKNTLLLYKQVEKICKELNITCFVTYGTLIGAIRHKGFIPWDDDFDVIMPRPDYDCFCDYCEKELEKSGRFFLCNGIKNHKVGFTISRFCDSNYIYYNTNGKKNDELGLFIDIYPLDGIGNSLDVIKKVSRKKKAIVKMLNLAYSSKPFLNNKGLIYGIARFPLYLLAHVIGRDFFIRQIKKMRRKFTYTDSKYVGLLIWDYKLIVYEKEWFAQAIEQPFEDTTVLCPKEYDKVLKKGYGNYMELPPENERKPYHQYYLVKKQKDNN